MLKGWLRPLAITRAAKHEAVIVRVPQRLPGLVFAGHDMGIVATGRDMSGFARSYPMLPCLLIQPSGAAQAMFQR